MRKQGQHTDGRYPRHLPGDEWGPECPYPPKATKNPDDYVKAALVLAGFILASTGIAGLLYLILTAGSKAVL